MRLVWRGLLAGVLALFGTASAPAMAVEPDLPAVCGEEGVYCEGWEVIHSEVSICEELYYFECWDENGFVMSFWLDPC